METSSRSQLILEKTPMEPRKVETRSIVRVTLSGPALISTIFTMIISLHVLKPSAMALLIALAPIPFIISNDYQAFISLGPGGTPSTFAGYLKITYLRLYALSDIYNPAPVLGPLYPATGFLSSASPRNPWISPRQGPRPLVAGIAPQRQISQIGCPKAHQIIRSTIYSAADHYPGQLRTDASCFEKTGLALFATCPLNRTCGGEICHVHQSDGSLHLNLHPLDAKVVLEHGWGQRHPLSKGGWMCKYVPREFIMVYAPRNQDEAEIVARIIEAAAWWVMGERMEIGLPKQRTAGQKEL